MTKLSEAQAEQRDLVDSQWKDRTDRLGFSADQYAKAVAWFNKELNEFEASRVRELLHGHLKDFGDPHSYAELHTLVQNVVDSTILQLVMSGFLVVGERGLASPEEQGKQYQVRLDSYRHYLSKLFKLDENTKMESFIPSGAYL